MTKLENRCANCGGKFGLVYHNHWGLRFCRKACKDDFLAKTARDHARMRKWFGWAASRKDLAGDPESVMHLDIILLVVLAALAVWDRGQQTEEPENNAIMSCCYEMHHALLRRQSFGPRRLTRCSSKPGAVLKREFEQALQRVCADLLSNCMSGSVR